MEKLEIIGEEGIVALIRKTESDFKDDELSSETPN